MKRYFLVKVLKMFSNATSHQQCSSSRTSTDLWPQRLSVLSTNQRPVLSAQRPSKNWQLVAFDQHFATGHFSRMQWREWASVSTATRTRYCNFSKLIILPSRMIWFPYSLQEILLLINSDIDFCFSFRRTFVEILF
jgi:hypothetical protein